MGHQQGRQPCLRAWSSTARREAVPQAQVEPAERLVQEQGLAALTAVVRESATRARWIRPRASTGSRSPKPARPASSKAASTRARRARRPLPRPAGRRPGSRPPSCAGTADRPGTGCRSGGAPAAGRRSRTSPRRTRPPAVNAGSRVPQMKASRLDLPQPLGPITVVASPGAHAAGERRNQQAVAEPDENASRVSAPAVMSEASQRRCGQRQDQAERQQRQHALHQGVEADDAAVGAGCEADGLGGQGGEAAGPGETGSADIGRRSPQIRPRKPRSTGRRSMRQPDAPEHAARRRPEAAGRTGVALVEARRNGSARRGIHRATRTAGDSRPARSSRRPAPTATSRTCRPNRNDTCGTSSGA